MTEALTKLVKKWEREGDFLSNPFDSSSDRQVGKTYKNCAEELQIVLDVLKEKL